MKSKTKQEKTCFSDTKALTRSLVHHACRTNSINGEVELLFKILIILHLEFISANVIYDLN